MKRTKVLFFIPNLYGGGAERVSVNIIKQLDRDHFDVSLLVLSSEHSVYDIESMNVNLIELNASKTIYSVFKLRTAIKKMAPDIIFCSLFRGHIALYLALYGLACKAKLILRSPNSPKLLLENNQLSLMYRLFIKKAYTKADLVIAQTPEMREEIIQHHQIKQEKVHFFLNPIDTMDIDEKTKNIENPFDTNDINVVAAGRITHQKGFDLLIKSFKSVVKSNEAFKLYIIGRDADGEIYRLKQIVEELNLDKHVFFLDFQSNPYRYYYYCDLYVLSSRWEGLPNTVLENMYLKKPIVSTRCIPFMETLIKDGDNGYLVEVGNTDALSEKILGFKNLMMRPSCQVDINNDVNALFKKMSGGEI